MKKLAALCILLFGIQYVSAQAGTQSKNNKTISVEGVGQTKTYISEGGNAEVSGTNNIITINGRISRLEVSGSGNTIMTDKVSSIVVEGTSNKVYYKSAPTKTGKPAVSSSGVGNNIEKK